MSNTPDLDAQIAAAERAVIESDRSFVEATGLLASSARAQAANASKLGAIAGVSLLGIWLIYRATARRVPSRIDRDHRVARVGQRSGAADFLGQTIGSAIRGDTAARPRGMLSMLAMPALSALSTLWRRRRMRVDRPQRAQPR